MVDVLVEGDKAVFEVMGSHPVWAFKSRLEIPLSHIRAVQIKTDPPMGWFDGLKLMGTDLPHVFRAGTFLWQGKTVFFDIKHPEKTVEIRLADETYNELLIEVEDLKPPSRFSMRRSAKRAASFRCCPKRGSRQGPRRAGEDSNPTKRGSRQKPTAPPELF